MGDWLEQKRSERTEAHLAHGVAIGDFVQLSSWFGDIWAEVVHVRIYQDASMSRFSGVDIVVYDKYGRSRNLESAYLGDIRTILPASEIGKRRGDIFHTIECKKGGNSLFSVWPSKAGKHTAYNPGGRDGGKEWHPDVPQDERSLNFRISR